MSSTPPRTLAAWDVYVAADGSPIARASRAPLRRHARVQRRRSLRVRHAHGLPRVRGRSHRERRRDDDRRRRRVHVQPAPPPPRRPASPVSASSSPTRPAPRRRPRSPRCPAAPRSGTRWTTSSTTRRSRPTSTANLIKARDRIINPSIARWLDQPLDFYVNENDTCNAFSTGNDVHLSRARRDLREHRPARRRRDPRVRPLVPQPLADRRRGRVRDVRSARGSPTSTPRTSPTTPASVAASTSPTPRRARSTRSAARRATRATSRRSARQRPDHQRRAVGSPQGVHRALGHDAGVALTEKLFTRRRRARREHPDQLHRRADRGRRRRRPRRRHAAPLHDRGRVRPHGLVPTSRRPRVGTPTRRRPHHHRAGHAARPNGTCPGPAGHQRHAALAGRTAAPRPTSRSPRRATTSSARSPRQPDYTRRHATRFSSTLDDGASFAFPDNPADPKYQLFIGDATPIYCANMDDQSEVDADEPPRREWQWAPPGFAEQHAIRSPRTPARRSSASNLDFGGNYLRTR